MKYLPLLLIACTNDKSPPPDTADSAAHSPGDSADPWEDEVLGAGDQGPEVQELYEWLARYGYFPSDTLAAQYEDWSPVVSQAPEDQTVYDDRFAEAVEAYQLLHGLNVSGEVDEETAALMGSPRCGFPESAADVVATTSGRTAPPYATGGGTWSETALTWRYRTGTTDLDASTVRSELKSAFGAWSDVITLDFAETSESADIEVDWGYIDGPYNVLAYAYYPDYGGDIVFDESDTWRVDADFDVFSVGAHEIGHSIGLGHSADPSAIMYSTYQGVRSELAQDDVDGARSLYPSRHRWDTSQWETLGDDLWIKTGAVNADGRLEVFATTSSGLLYHAWQSSAGAGPWSTESMLYDMDQVEAAQNADGRLEIFGIGNEGLLWHRWQTTAGGAWSDWASMSWLMTEPAAARNADGRLELFAVGGEGLLYHTWQTSAGGAWSDYESTAWQMTQPVVVANTDGRLEVFAVGNDGILAHKWQTSAGGAWSDWEQLSWVLSSPTVGRNEDGRLEVFAVGSDGYLYHSWQATAGGGPWSDWNSFEWQVTNPTVVSRADGRLEVFAIGSEGYLYHRWQVEANGSWSDWAYMGVSASAGPVVLQNADGRLEVFVTTPEGHLVHTWQD